MIAGTTFTISWFLTPAPAARVMPRKRRPAAVDLFCGAGGLSYGMQRAGIRICAGVDLDPDCRYPFERNVKARFLERDIADLGHRTIRSMFPKGSVKILAGCAPCQPFSSYTQGDGHDRWTALSRFGELVDKVRPDIVTMENVPGLTKYRIFKKYIGVLDRAGYEHDHKIVNCVEYGVPQTRRRLVLLASRHGKITVMRGTRAGKPPVTVRATIGGLERLGAGMTSRSDRLHKSSGLSPRNMRRMRRSAQGGTWRDWDSRLRSRCHKRNRGSSYGSVYGRMSWDRPAPTITTQFYGFGSGRFGHPRQNRALSLREGALLQTFPRKYSFLERNEAASFKRIGKLIGNAVPVKLGTAIGRCITSHLEDEGVI